MGRARDVLDTYELYEKAFLEEMARTRKKIWTSDAIRDIGRILFRKSVGGLSGVAAGLALGGSVGFALGGPAGAGIGAISTAPITGAIGSVVGMFSSLEKIKRVIKETM